MEHSFSRSFQSPSLVSAALLLIVVSLVPSELKAQQFHGGKDYFDPIGLFLTWQQDPTTTMTIDWHIINEDRNILEFRERGTGTWSDPITARMIEFPFSDRTIQRVELTGLQPGTDYEFKFGESSKVYYFRTMPSDLSQPLRIAVGGDTMHRQKWMEKTARQAMKYDIDFVFIQGDLAYADGLSPEKQRQRDTQTPRAHNQWYSFFNAYKNTLITDDYRVVPMVVTIGNHEIRGGYYFRDDRRPDDPAYSDTDEWKKEVAPYFFRLFAMPGLPGYNVLDFGDYLSLLLLDTDHANPVENQVAWIRQTLAERSQVPHLIPGYHVPAYPSVRNYNDEVQKRVRELWVPEFEKGGVQLVFEAHDHAYKRTFPIRENEVRSNGIVYVGDGAWGTETREIASRQDYENWYIVKAASERHFILLTLHGTQRHMKMISSTGKVLDEYPETP
ncbi:MAG: metallophosphoesterase family protein [Balneolaceae bacterium]|nr:MAG: metallophosphoesterase family protein [Balneolaceae bacterium]